MICAEIIFELFLDNSPCFGDCGIVQYNNIRHTMTIRCISTQFGSVCIEFPGSRRISIAASSWQKNIHKCIEFSHQAWYLDRNASKLHSVREVIQPDTFLPVFIFVFIANLYYRSAEALLCAIVIVSMSEFTKMFIFRRRYGYRSPSAADVTFSGTSSSNMDLEVQGNLTNDGYWARIPVRVGFLVIIRRGRTYFSFLVRQFSEY